jgi:hypothetical protein
MFFPEFALILLALSMKIYQTLNSVAQFSQFLIQNNGPPSLLEAANSSVSNMYQVAHVQMQVITACTM